MTTYEVTAWCSVPHYTTFEIDAGNIQEALDKAKLQARDEHAEPCGGGESDWDEFEIESDEDAAQYVRHLEPALLAAIHAVELRDALQDGLNIAHRVVDSWESGDLAASVRALSQWRADSRATLDQATQQ